MSRTTLTLRARRDGAELVLESPSVGWFTDAARPGAALVGGARAGVLITLGRSFELLVPDDVAGLVDGPHPERVHAPVGFGTPLYRLRPLEGAGVASATSATSASGALLFRSPSAGRFWQRSAPGDPPFVSVGDVIEAGHAVGLVEVMKTFTLVHYQPSGGLPTRARVAKLLAADGSEVAEKAALLELEPA